jgi:TfoX/Sxy family transcriptional regulator of competence genes
MAYDEGLAHRIRDVWADRHDVEEKKMFGGLCFLVRGNMAAGIVRDELMLRVGPDGYQDALEQPHAREMTFTGKPLRGMIYVGTAGFEEDEDLHGWLARSLTFNATLDAKTAKKKTAKKKTAKKKTAKKKTAKKKTAKKKTAKKKTAKKKTAKKKTAKKKTAKKKAGR